MVELKNAKTKLQKLRALNVQLKSQIDIIKDKCDKIISFGVSFVDLFL